MFPVLSDDGLLHPLGGYENQYLFEARLLVETGNLVFINTLNDQFSPSIFVPYNYVQIDEKTLPFGWLGYIGLLAGFYAARPELVFIVTPLFGALAVFMSSQTFKIPTTTAVFQQLSRMFIIAVQKARKYGYAMSA